MYLNRFLASALFLISFVFQIYCGLDPSFGTSGVASSSFGREDILYFSMIQTNSSVVVGGSTSNSMINKVLLSRYTASGVLDTTFNGTGMQTALVGSMTFGLGGALQSDGKIIVAGYTYQSQTDIICMRFTTTGALDTTFNSVGYITTTTGIGAAANTASVQSDGKIVLAGVAVDEVPKFALVRYDSSGALDNTFGTSGIVTTIIGSYGVIQDIALQSDGKIVAGGYCLDISTNKFALARYNTNGTLDTTFGTQGVVWTAVGSYAIIQSVALQTDQKIVVAGWAIVSGVLQFAVARYTTTGALDTTFNTTGIVLTNIQGYSAANAVAIQLDGNIVVGGFSLGDNSDQFAIARYTTAGALDATFGTAGIMLTTIPIGSNNTVSGVQALSISTYILAAGYTDRDIALAAYTI